MDQKIKRIQIQNQFDQAAQGYSEKYRDSSPISHLFRTRLMRVYEMLGKVEGLKILDVGCGPGIISTHILENRGRYFGIDISRKMLNQCRRTLGEDEDSPLSQSTIENLPFSNASFDGALCLGVLEYVEDLESAFEELSRVLKDDAIAIVSMQNRSSLFRFWERHIHSGFLFNLLRKLARRPFLAKPTEKLISSRALKRILSRHHLVVKDALYYNFNLWLKPFDRWFPDLAVKTSRKLEVLRHSVLGGLLGADILIKAEKVISEVESIITPLL
jgi:ubiquinone/menaquinone biosynthesis C-methylase UbiE